jgi:hypothetical protein
VDTISCKIIDFPTFDFLEGIPKVSHTVDSSSVNKETFLSSKEESFLVMELTSTSG